MIYSSGIVENNNIKPFQQPLQRTRNENGIGVKEKKNLSSTGSMRAHLKLKRLKPERGLIDLASKLMGGEPQE